MIHEVFVSYSRRDNTPRAAEDEEGWVSGLCRELLLDHRRFSTEPLKVFLDTQAISSFDDWREKILKGLRSSRILLACLSRNYFQSPPCFWEWEEFQRRRVHSLVGGENVAPVVLS